MGSAPDHGAGSRWPGNSVSRSAYSRTEVVPVRNSARHERDPGKKDESAQRLEEPRGVCQEYGLNQSEVEGGMGTFLKSGTSRRSKHRQRPAASQSENPGNTTRLRTGKVVMLHRVASILLGLVLALLVAELTLQAAALLARDRSGAWRHGAQVRILCVGDSHTFGTIVAAEESYPARLQTELDEAAPGHYSVLNLGVPGMSTTQVRNRLSRYAARYEPDLILVWVGQNNMWNQAEVAGSDASWTTRLDGILYHIRLYRLVRVWLHDQSLGAVAAAINREQPTRKQQQNGQSTQPRRFGPQSEKPMGDHQTWLMWHGDVVETIPHGKREQIDFERAAERALTDYRAMVGWARASQTPIAFLAYPIDTNIGGAINSALRRLSAEMDVLLIETHLAVERVAPEEREFLWAGHPNAAMYAQIAQDVARNILSGIPP